MSRNCDSTQTPPDRVSDMEPAISVREIEFKLIQIGNGEIFVFRIWDSLGSFSFASCHQTFTVLQVPKEDIATHGSLAFGALSCDQCVLFVYGH